VLSVKYQTIHAQFFSSKQYTASQTFRCFLAMLFHCYVCAVTADVVSETLNYAVVPVFIFIFYSVVVPVLWLRECKKFCSYLCNAFNFCTARLHPQKIQLSYITNIETFKMQN